jgi:hypothetical protein
LTRLPRFDNGNTLEDLRDSGITCAPLDSRLLSVYLRRQVDAGFLPAAGVG